MRVQVVNATQRNASDEECSSTLLIDEILLIDLDATRKQRHTATPDLPPSDLASRGRAASYRIHRRGGQVIVVHDLPELHDDSSGGLLRRTPTHHHGVGCAQER